MGRKPKPHRAYNFVVTGIDVDGKRFRLETNSINMARSVKPWRGTLWSVAADGTRSAVTNYRFGEPIA